MTSKAVGHYVIVNGEKLRPNTTTDMCRLSELRSIEAIMSSQDVKIATFKKLKEAGILFDLNRTDYFSVSQLDSDFTTSDFRVFDKFISHKDEN